MLKGKVVGNLYVFDVSVSKNCNKQKQKKCMNVVSNDYSCNKTACNTTVKDIQDNSTCAKSLSTANTALSHTHTWHKRLAHAPLHVLQHINQLKIPCTIAENERAKLQSCEACARTHSASGIFEIVHMDI